jgi:hypothetical protein
LFWSWPTVTGSCAIPTIYHRQDAKRKGNESANGQAAMSGSVVCLGALGVLRGEIGSSDLAHRKLGNSTEVEPPKETTFADSAEFSPFVDFVIFVVNPIGVWQQGAEMRTNGTISFHHESTESHE